MKSQKLKNLAVVGCGAIARAFYLPALAKHRAHFGHIWLVEPNEHALTAAASVLPAERATRLADVDDDLHLVVVATPNHLHYSLASQALTRGSHVLIEKPFVIWPDEGRMLVRLAAAQQRVAAVNQTRRLYPLAGELRRRIERGEFGRLRSIVHREGVKLTWPFESGAAFAPGARRTGVVIDFGVHVLDFYHYILQPQWALTSAIHDGFDGPEGLAEIELLANGAPVSIRLSRYHEQENVARLTFERATIVFNVYDGTAASIQLGSGKPSPLVIGDRTVERRTYADRLLLNFVAATERRESAVCEAASSLPVIEILDEIYRAAQHFPATLGSV